MKNILFIAPPTAGKGTQSKMITSKYKIPHVSVGQLLRDEVEKNTEIGKIVEEDIKVGNLVDDSILSKLIIKRLKANDCDNGFILDGFPRSPEQIKYLEQIESETNKSINNVFLLEIEKELALKRTIGRLICSNCGENYNDLFDDSKPRIENKCDVCSGSLIRRVDDKPEVFEHRYQIYVDGAKDIIDYFEKRGILTKIDASISKEYTFSKIEEGLEKND